MDDDSARLIRRQMKKIAQRRNDKGGKPLTRSQLLRKALRKVEQYGGKANG